MHTGFTGEGSTPATKLLVSLGSQQKEYLANQLLQDMTNSQNKGLKHEQNWEKDLGEVAEESVSQGLVVVACGASWMDICIKFR